MVEDQKNGDQVRWRSSYMPPDYSETEGNKRFRKEYNQNEKEKHSRTVKKLKIALIIYLSAFAITLWIVAFLWRRL